MAVAAAMAAMAEAAEVEAEAVVSHFPQGAQESCEFGRPPCWVRI